MHARRPTAAWLLLCGLVNTLAAGCSPELDVPAGARLSCEPGDSCPSGQLCFDGLCLRAEEVPPVPPRPELAAPPTVEPPLGRQATTFTVSFRLDAAPAAAPVLELDLELPEGASPTPSGSVEAPCAEEEALSFRCSYTATGDERSGAGGTVRFDVRLAEELVRRNVGAFELDFLGPDVVPGSTRLALAPPVGAPVPAVTAATEGTSVAVSFETTELLAAGSGVHALQGGAVLELSLLEAGGLAYRAETVLGARASLLPGTHELVATLRDAAGNQREVVLPATLELAPALPAAPDVETPGRVLYRRLPWGAEETRRAPCAAPEGAAGPCFLVVGDGAVTAGTTVIAWDGLDGDAAEIGRTVADGAGSFVLKLDPRDRRSVALSSADAAGNVSSRVEIRDGEWVATLGRKQPGSTFENPTTVATTPVLLPVLRQDPARLREPSAAELAALATLDGDRAASATRAGEGTWLPRSTAGPRPAARAGHALAYDAARGRVVLFGGRNPIDNEPLADTWEWDGATATWSERTPAGAGPRGRQGHALAWDPERGVVVLFGGSDAFAPLADLWEWDGAAGGWTERTPAAPSVSPAPRHAHALAWDGKRGRVVLFGGTALAEGSFLPAAAADLWEWDGAAGAWTEREASGAWPTPRSGHVLAWDDAGGRVVLFGGTGAEWLLDRAQAGSREADLWEWDGAAGSFTERIAAGSAPPPRAAPAAAFDQARRRLVVHGGLDAAGDELADLWEWDPVGGSWEERQGGGGAPARQKAGAAAFDVGNGRVVVHGGADTTIVSPDGITGITDVSARTWEWDGASWAERAPGPSTPGPRTGASVAFDPRRGKALLFGGQDATGALRAELFEWEPGSGAFIDRTPRPLPGAWPAPRRDAGLAWDETRGVAVLVGGLGASGTLDDSWLLDAATATFVSGPPVPGARSQPALADDPARGRVLLFGGFGGGGAPLGELLAWNGSAWQELPPVGPAPSPRGGAAMILDPATGGLFLFGGRNAAASLDDGWRWDPSTSAWTEEPRSAQAPEPRSEHALVRDGATGLVVMHGGLGDPGARGAAPQPLAGTWLHDGTGWQRWSPVSASVAEPPSRRGDAFLHDPAAGVSYLLGAAGTATVWEFDGRTVDGLQRGSWSSRAGAAEALEGFGGFLAASDPSSGKTTIVGRGEPMRAWDWDGAAGRLTDRRTAGGPPGRDNSALAFAPSCGAAVLFGGDALAGGTLADTWLWSPAAGTWTEAPAGAAPPGRGDHGLVWDERREKLVLYGGGLDDLWEWDCVGGWLQRALPAVRPPVRRGGGLGYDARRGVVVIFGGYDGGRLVDDLWEWDGAAGLFRDRTPSPRPGSWPAARMNALLGYDPGRGTTVLYGGDSTRILEDLWEWDGETFRERSPSGHRPPASSMGAFEGNAALGVVDLFGNSGEDGIWTWDGGARDRPAALWTVPFSAAGERGAQLLGGSVTAGAFGSGAGAVELLAWDTASGAWTGLASGAGGTTLSAELDPARLEGLVSGSLSELTIAVAPAEPNGEASALAVIALDYLELRIRYRR